MPKHIVAEGESVSSIATEHGLFWDTVWNHPDNAELKRERKDPDVLQAGDALFIPDKRRRDESGATEKRHRFRRKGVPAHLVLVLMRTQKPAEVDKAETAGPEWWSVTEPPLEPLPEEPEADAPFHLMVDGQWFAEGKTDKKGRLDVVLPPNAQAGTLVLYRGTPQERVIELNLRQMDPIATLSGVCKRLVNLGYPCPIAREEITPEVTEAIAAFQRKAGLEVTGEPDDATRSKLVEAHGG